jgi:acyl carrier protein
MTSEVDLGSYDSIRDWIVRWMANELNLEPVQIEAEKSFLAHGMDSMSAMMLVGDLEGLTGRRLPPTLAWDHPSVAELARHLASEGASLESRPASTLPAAGNGPTDPRAILSQLDGMSEEDMDVLLQEYLGRSN